MLFFTKSFVVSKNVRIFAVSIWMSCVTEGWADILEEALAFCSCSPIIGEFEVAVKSES